MQTIDAEATRNAGLITDLDNFRSRYLESDYEKGQAVIYPSSEIYAYEQNLFIMLAQSTLEKFKPSWTMRPDYASYDLYGTVIHWTLLLFVNSIYSVEDFRGLDEILVPPIDILHEIIRTRVPKSQIENLDPFIVIPGIEMFLRKPLDKIETDKMKAKASLDNNAAEMAAAEAGTPLSTQPTLVEIVDQFLLTQDDLDNMYVDLIETPINSSSIYMYLENFNIPQKYGYDFVLTTDGNTLYKRISWNPDKCFNGRSSLASLLAVNSVMKIKYLKVTI